MHDISILRRLLSILLSIILIATPASSALSARYDLNSSKNNIISENKDLKSLQDRLLSLKPDTTFPLTLKQQAYRDMSSIILLKNKNNKDIIQKLEKARFSISESIASRLWYDSTHLRPVRDDHTDKNKKESEIYIETTVFKSEKTAVQNILEIISKNKDGSIDDALLNGIIISLLQADRNIAQISIMDAQFASSLYGDNPGSNGYKKNKNLEKAQNEFDIANEKIRKSEPVDAIEHFEKSWEYSATELFELDKATMPAITFDPVSSYINTTNIRLSGYVDDVAYYSIPNITIEVNGIPSTFNLTGGRFDTVLVLNEGEYHVSATVVDYFGNTGAKSITFIVDTTLPEVTIIEPKDNDDIRDIREILANVYDLYLKSITLFINDVQVSNAANYTFNTINYPDGNYTISAEAFDLANNTAYDSISVVVDNTPPVLSVSELNLYPTINNSEYQLLITSEAGANITLNDMSLTLDNDSATYKTNVILGINNFIVTAIDRADNMASWNKTILVDEDDLPDWYETNITGTDPLNADSDSTKTTSNEASNGISDDQEDFDKDGLTNLQEFRLGTNPFAGDSDSDGLTDWFEVFKTGTYPTSTDTDGNAITDANEDFDTDGLANMQEQSLGTDPLNPDTDDDTLKDGYEINILKTNPLIKDTDNDGLEDDSELRLSTNPLNPDSNGNGILDGKESYTQTFKNSTAGVETTVNGVGDIGKSIVLAKDNSSALMSSLPGFVNTVDISTSSQVNSVNVKVYYNESILGSIPESELKLFYYNETSNALELVADQGINTTGNYVWGHTNHLSIYGIATPRDWFNQWYVNWKMPGQVFKIGDRMRIKANVHNTGQGPASNVKVEFRESSQSGTLIGTTTIPSIAAGSSALTSIEWTVKSGTTQICVNVDPANLIAEVSEGNNNACGDFSSNLDSDGDGLTDYEETNGMRVAFPNAFVKSYAGNAHSDNDGLTDGYEMGRIVYDPGNKLLYDSLATLYGWDKSLYDGYHYEYKADPMKTDTDGDRLNDKEELDLELDPFVYSPYNLVEAGYGFSCGDFCSDDSRHQNLPYLGGWLVSGYLVFGDIRDLPSAVIKGDALSFVLTGVALVPYIGDAESTLTKIVKMAGKSEKMMLDTFEMVAKSDKLRPLLVRAVDAVTGGKATTLIGKGAKEEDIVHIAANRGNFKETIGVARDDVLKQTRWLEEGTSAWGWIKIKEVHWNDIINVFGQKTEPEVQEMILKTLKNGKLTKSIPNDQYRYTMEFLGKDGKLQNFHVVVSDRAIEIGGIGKGNVVTAFPEIIS